MLPEVITYTIVILIYLSKITLSLKMYYTEWSLVLQHLSFIVLRLIISPYIVTKSKQQLMLDIHSIFLWENESSLYSSRVPIEFLTTTEIYSNFSSQ